MDQALWVAKTGLEAQQTRMAVVSNNLANVSTTGFKKGRAAFEDLLYQVVRQPGAATSQQNQLPTGLTFGTGVRIVATEKSFAQGNLSQTSNALDLAVNGRGFFSVLLPDGTAAYTRDGSFSVDSQGQIVTAGGFVVQPGITVPDAAQSVTIGNDGTVSVQLPGDPAPVQVGTIALTDFINPGGLQPRGENMFLETAASGPAQTGTAGVSGLGAINQGMLETSNVSVVEELVNMIETQRAYEINAKAIATTDAMLQFLNSNV